MTKMSTLKIETIQDTPVLSFNSLEQAGQFGDQSGFDALIKLTGFSLRTDLNLRDLVKRDHDGKYYLTRRGCALMDAMCRTETSAAFDEAFKNWRWSDAGLSYVGQLGKAIDYADQHRISSNQSLFGRLFKFGKCSI